MATAAHPEPGPRSETHWDGRARCRLCADGFGLDQDWCPAAEALVCDSCCEEIPAGQPSKLQSAARPGREGLAPMEILAACASCPRFMRVLDEEEEFDPDHVH